MTNKEWFWAKVNKMSDEELAGLIAEYKWLKEIK